MMSSEEETDCFVKQDRLLLKKNRRTRQRVDAGEPRNSYASIPNFSSRPPAPPYLLSSPPPPQNSQLGGGSALIHGGAFLNLGVVESHSPNNGWLLADHDRGASPMIVDTNNIVHSNNNNKDNLAATKGGAPGGELRHLHPLMSYRHQRSPIRALQRSPHHQQQQQQGGQRAHNFRRRSHSLDNNNLLGSDGDHQQQQDCVISDSVAEDCSALNGNNNNNNNNNVSVFRDGGADSMAPQQHGPGHHQSRSRGAGRGSPAGSTSSVASSTNNEAETATQTNSSSSQLLREILQGGTGKLAADTLTNGRSGSPATRGNSSYLLSTNENGSKSATNGSLISHLLSKNNSLQLPISARTRNTSRNKSNAAAASAAPPENKEEDEDEEEEGEEAPAPALAANEVDGTVVQGSPFANHPEDDEEEMREGEEEERKPEVEEIGGAGVSTRSRQSRAKMNGERSPSSSQLPSETEIATATANTSSSSSSITKRSRRLFMDVKREKASDNDLDEDGGEVVDDDDEADALRQVAAASSAEGEEEDEEEMPLATDNSAAGAAALVDNNNESCSAFANTPQNAEAARPQSQSQPTDAELKRARVEKLISTMRSSPSRTAPGDGAAVNGCKKRKRYMPQQHEARVATASVLSSANSDGGGRLSPGFDEDDAAAEEEEFLASMAPAAKMRRTHQQVVLRHQLNLMQAQIAAIQQKLDTYGQPESSDSEEVAEAEASAYNSDDGQMSNSGFATAGSRPTPPPRPASMPARPDSPMMDEDMTSPGPPALYHRYGFSGPSGTSELRISSAPSQAQPPPMTMGKSPRTPDLEPAHFIDEARRLVYEQERVTKEADTRKMAPPAMSVAAMTSSSPAEPKVAVTAAAAAAAVAAASGPVPRPPFAVVPHDWESLADTLKAGMSTLIDDWVRRFASTARPSSAGPLLAALVKADSGNNKEACRPVTGASIQTSVAPGNPATPSSSSSVAASASSAALMSTVVSMGNGTSFHHHQSLGGGLMSTASAAAAAASSHLADRRSPRTKVIDRGRMSAGGQMPPGVSLMGPGGVSAVAAAFLNSSAVHHFNEMNLKPEPNSMSGLFSPHHHKGGAGMPLYMPHPGPPPQHHQLPPSLASFYSQHRMTQGGGGGGGQGGRESPEQSEALPLVVTPKKKRHKVTDTRITPRTVSRILGHQESLMESASGGGGGGKYMLGGAGGGGGGGGGASPAEVGYGGHHHHPHHHHSHPPPPMVPVSLPTSVAIPNPGLHQSDVFSPYPYFHPSHQPRASPGSDGMDDAASLFHPSHPHHQALHSTLLLGQRSPDPVHISARSALKTENGGDSSDCNSGDLMYSNDGTMPTSSTLTPMHLRKAKLMFFFVRYPSSAILKTYFPDIQFNKNNTAQLVKWFSNFREFYYIQMEKYARQAISEGCKNAEDITVTVDSELYRVINLHYNRNNHIEVPTNFRFVVEQTLREFFKAVSAGKDTEQSWKKSIYKVIARLDDNLPDYFKSPNFLEQLE